MKQEMTGKNKSYILVYPRRWQIKSNCYKFGKLIGDWLLIYN